MTEGVEFNQLLKDADWNLERFEAIRTGVHQGDRTQAMKTLRAVAEARRSNDAR